MSKTLPSEKLIPRLYERDIDVLLQEELLFNASVRQLFAERAGITGPVKITNCELSVFDAPTGETDVLATYVAGTKNGHLLIENKIDAAFQPQQPERYKARAIALSATGAVECFTLLVAPAAYNRSTDKALTIFDGIVTYEELASAIEAEGNDRSRHRAALVKRTIEKARSAYVLIPAPEVSAFWRRIFAIANGDFGELRMKRPGEKGSNSNWVIWKADLPPKITIDWKIGLGVVDLNFWKEAPHKPLPSIDVAHLSAKHDVAGESTLIRIPVSSPPAKWTELTDEQIIEALTAAVTLLRFYRSNPSAFA